MRLALIIHAGDHRNSAGKFRHGFSEFGDIDQGFSSPGKFVQLLYFSMSRSPNPANLPGPWDSYLWLCGGQRRIWDQHTLCYCPRYCEIVRAGEVYLIDHVYFSRPGPRVVQGLEILAQLTHPEIFSGLVPPNVVAKLDRSTLVGSSRPNLAECFRPYPGG